MTACSLPAVVARLRLAARCRARYFTAVVVVGLVPLALWGGASLLVLPRARTSLACSLLPAQLPNFAEPPFSPPNRPRAQTARLSQVGARPKRACTLTVTVGCRHSPLRCASVRLVFGATIVGPKI